MKYNILLILVVLSLTLYGEAYTKVSLNELLLERETSLEDLAISLEEMKRVSLLIEEYKPDIILFDRDIEETSVKQLVYTLHSKGLTEYNYYFGEKDMGIIQRGEITF